MGASTALGMAEESNVRFEIWRGRPHRPNENWTSK
jgi:hypothetical protein